MAWMNTLFDKYMRFAASSVESKMTWEDNLTDEEVDKSIEEEMLHLFIEALVLISGPRGFCHNAAKAVCRADKDAETYGLFLETNLTFSQAPANSQHRWMRRGELYLCRECSLRWKWQT